MGFTNLEASRVADHEERIRKLERIVFPSPPEQEQPDRSVEELAKRLRLEAHFHRNDPFELLNNDLAADLLEEAAALLRKLADSRDLWNSQCADLIKQRYEAYLQIAKQQEHIEELHREIARLSVIADPAIARRQFPDGSVPGNGEEAAIGWHNLYEQTRSQLLSSQEREKRLWEVVQKVQGIAYPHPSRNFDTMIADMGMIDDLCRAALQQEGE